MRTIMIMSSCFLLSCFVAGCGDDRSAAVAPTETTTATATPSTTPYVEGGSLKPFYAEVFHEGRYYLFGTKPALAKFLEAHEANPLQSKSFIGKGPNRATVVAQTSKDVTTMTDRLIAQFRKRNNMPAL